MPIRTTPEHQAAIARFWERYIDILKNQGVAKPFSKFSLSTGSRLPDQLG
jgi:hypothetical protein